MSIEMQLAKAIVLLTEAEEMVDGSHVLETPERARAIERAREAIRDCRQEVIEEFFQVNP